LKFLFIGFSQDEIARRSVADRRMANGSYRIGTTCPVAIVPFVAQRTPRALAVRL